MLPFSFFKIRKSTNLLCGDVKTIVEVGSLASFGNQRIDFRIEMKPDILWIHGKKSFFDWTFRIEVKLKTAT